MGFKVAEIAFGFNNGGNHCLILTDFGGLPFNRPRFIPYDLGMKLVEK
jgi:hypothetical protein